jgi:hypothetical protein
MNPLAFFVMFPTVGTLIGACYWMFGRTEGIWESLASGLALGVVAYVMLILVTYIWLAFTTPPH